MAHNLSSFAVVPEHGSWRWNGQSPKSHHRVSPNSPTSSVVCLGGCWKSNSRGTYMLSLEEHQEQYMSKEQCSVQGRSHGQFTKRSDYLIEGLNSQIRWYLLKDLLINLEIPDSCSQFEHWTTPDHQYPHYMISLRLPLPCASCPWRILTETSLQHTNLFIDMLRLSYLVQSWIDPDDEW